MPTLGSAVKFTAPEMLALGDWQDKRSVSYTHLTLPTKRIV